MQLTPELFEQITGFPESSLEQLQSKVKNDLRVAPRLPLAFRAAACRIDSGRFDPPIQIHICEISVMGITLTHAVEQRLGKAFVVAVRPHSKGQPIAIYCEMTNFQSAGQTLMRVGAKFVRVGTDLDVRHCIGIAISGNSTPHAPSVTPSAPSKPAHPTVQPPVRATPPATEPAASLEAGEIQRIRDAMLS